MEEKEKHKIMRFIKGIRGWKREMKMVKKMKVKVRGVAAPKEPMTYAWLEFDY